MSSRPRQTFQYMAAISLVGLIVGLTSALATTGFVEAVAYLSRLLYVSPQSRVGLESTPLALITIGVLTAGGLAVGLLLRFGVDRGSPCGPPDTIFAVQLQERLPTPVSGAVSSLAAVLSLGCGAPVGQYGPLVYLGTLVGQLTNRLSFGLRDVRSIAIACGVAAAISTAFNAPIAALIFTHEVILRHYSLRMFTAVTVASACGYLVANVLFDYPALFLLDFTGRFRGVEFLMFALEGIACGALAVAFMKLLHQATRLAERIPIMQAAKPMLAGFAVSLVALRVPEVLGAGEDVFAGAFIGGTYAADALLLILFAKLLVTVLCIGFGFAGGVIFPSLLIGALFGALFASLVPALMLDAYSGSAVYAVCGMAALMSPIIGAPMTGLLLVFEFTHNYEITIAAMLTIVFANLVASQWYGRSYFDFQLAERGIDLARGRERAYLMHRKVADYLTAALPTVSPADSIGDLRLRMSDLATDSAIVVDDEERFLGQVSQHQLQARDDEASVASLELEPATTFDRQTSIWEAMETMRGYIGEAIPVVDSSTGRYLGAIPEAVVINAYLDAVEELRREEHEA